MADEKYVRPSLTDAQSIMVGGNCYGRVGPSDHPPDAIELEGEYGDCDDCQPIPHFNCCGSSPDAPTKCCFSDTSWLVVVLDITVYWNNELTDSIHRNLTFSFDYCFWYGSSWAFHDGELNGSIGFNNQFGGAFLIYAKNPSFPVTERFEVRIDWSTDPNANCCGGTFQTTEIKEIPNDPYSTGQGFRAVGTCTVQVLGNQCCASTPNEHGAYECLKHPCGCGGSSLEEVGI